MKKKVKLAIAVLILLGTLVAFARYAGSHPALLRQLKTTSPLIMIVVIGSYFIGFLALVVILRVSMRMYDKPISRQENFLLNAYSSLINFFGPGQSGPALRGLYLKKRHGLGIKKYIFTSLLYYGFYAIISAFLLLVGSRPWWQTLLLVVAAGAGSLVIIRWYAKRSKIKDEPGINLTNLGWLFAATALQVAMQTLAFAVELRSVQPGISMSQILTYTGAANFSLFVALTPGAIGIREAFLVFSSNLHHISNAVIITANVIDRAMYLVFMGILFVTVLSLHAKDKLRFKYFTSDANDEKVVS